MSMSLLSLAPGTAGYLTSVLRGDRGTSPRLLAALDAVFREREYELAHPNTTGIPYLLPPAPPHACHMSPAPGPADLSSSANPAPKQRKPYPKNRKSRRTAHLKPVQPYLGPETDTRGRKKPPARVSEAEIEKICQRLVNAGKDFHYLADQMGYDPTICAACCAGSARCESITCWPSRWCCCRWSRPSRRLSGRRFRIRPPTVPILLPPPQPTRLDLIFFLHPGTLSPSVLTVLSCVWHGPALSPRRTTGPVSSVTRAARRGARLTCQAPT
jgi:hypothetical protein